LQKEIQYIIKTLAISLAIALVISVVLSAITFLFEREFNLDSVFVREFLYGTMMAFMLTLINSTYFDFLTSKVSWNPNKEYQRILAGFLGSIPLSIAGIWLVRFIIEIIIEKKSMDAFWENQIFSNYLGSLIVTFVVLLIYYLITLYKKLQENKFKEQKIIAGNASAQFETLKNQIDPHFLFNSLNVLSSLIEENPENAQRFTTSLSKIYRYVLEQKDKELVPLQEELDFAKTYMKLLTIRFENSLTYSLPETLIDPEAKVVPLSLQLLFENTIKHNIVSDMQPLHISISVEGDYLVISNNLQKKDVLKSGEGVGLKNIVSRYAILTSKQVNIESDTSSFKVKIPILTKEISLINNKKYNEVDAYLKAKKQVKDIKDFYGNLVSYCIVIPLLAFINYQTSWQFKWFVFPMIGWGLGVALQAFSVFGYGRSWEERKIHELMEKQQYNNQQKWQ
jgi:two-component system, LytTR family, sensor kinase